MANEQPQEKKPRETREADKERKPSQPGESHEGSPGYGQPPPDVRQQPLPQQKW